MATRQVISTAREVILDYDDVVALFVERGLEPPTDQEFSIQMRRGVGNSSLVGFLDENHKLVIQYMETTVT